MQLVLVYTSPFQEGFFVVKCLLKKFIENDLTVDGKCFGF